MRTLNLSFSQAQTQPRKIYTSLLISLIAGAALATVGSIAPANAIPIVIDSFQTPTSISFFGQNTQSSTATVSNDLSATTTRLATLATTAPNASQSSTLAISGGTFSTTTGTGGSRTATSTLEYSNFGNFNFIGAGASEFNFGFSRTGGAIITITIEATGPGGTATLINTSPAAPNVTFAFSSFTNPTVFNNVTALRILVGTSSSSTATLGPIRAVPVPPAFLGTLLTAGLVVAKGLKKKSTLFR